MDGTFKVAPELFMQLFTIHALVDNRAIPSVRFNAEQKTDGLRTSTCDVPRARAVE